MAVTTDPEDLEARRAEGLRLQAEIPTPKPGRATEPRPEDDWFAPGGTFDGLDQLGCGCLWPIEALDEFLRWRHRRRIAKAERRAGSE